MKIANTIKISILASVLGLTLNSAIAHDAPSRANMDNVTLKQAVLTAQQHTGAQATEAEREVEMGQVFYQVKLINESGKSFETVINASTGAMVLSHENSKRGKDQDDLLENIAWYAGVTSGDYQSLLAAVEAAETKFNAQVYEIEFEDDYGFINEKPAYEIKLIDANGKRKDTHIMAKL